MAMRELERSVAVRVCGSVCVGVERLFLCEPFSLTLYICIAASQANENALLFEPKYPHKLINCTYIDVSGENWRYLF